MMLFYSTEYARRDHFLSLCESKKAKFQLENLLSKLPNGVLITERNEILYSNQTFSKLEIDDDVPIYDSMTKENFVSANPKSILLNLKEKKEEDCAPFLMQIKTFYGRILF